MTTITRAPASPPKAPTPLDLDTRLALTEASMNVRLDEAAVAFEVNTAHVPATPPVEITVPHLPQATIPRPYRTPIAALLHRARLRIEADGWCRDNLYDDRGAICPVRAIRLEAGSRSEADGACVLLLEAIQRDFRSAETIPSWNAVQRGPQPVLAAFDRATQLAHARNQ
ncbi:DUF6197 family protein [Streptomyces sp. NRRL F-5135]|uniref:DUF6197 family protein n=1 Tax=Streptomyces sp. NRRL F-5135 TaxID=1463858 RepID=UPI00068CEB6D|nr:hypothetical protein [Streptomyces sp. NRRL F-5135]